jgi:hypothetical protein
MTAEESLYPFPPLVCIWCEWQGYPSEMPHACPPGTPSPFDLFGEMEVDGKEAFRQAMMYMPSPQIRVPLDHDEFDFEF